jgi:hypothetical protein
VMTIVWKERMDGVPGYLYVNGIEKHLD